jgi:AraC-like DNA-binding protein
MTQAGSYGTLSRLFNGGTPVVIQPVPAEVQIHLQHLMEFVLFAADRQGSLPTVQNALAALLCVFSDLYRAQEEAPEAAEKNTVVYAVHYIKHHYASAITLDGLAALTRMSRKELCCRFKRFTGKTVHEFLNGVRIAKALEVIGRGGALPSLSSLSALCGYTDYTTFYRNFQRIVGISPAAYIAMRSDAAE